MAFDFPDSPAVGDEYVSGGATYFWTGTTWDLQTAGTIADKVDKAGDTMVGLLTIDGVNNPSLAINNPAGAFNNRIQGNKGGDPRWTIDLGSAVVEDANNGGSDFVIYRFLNNGTYAKAMEINRNVGFMTLSSGIGFGNVAHAAGSKDLSKHISLYGGAAGTFGFNITGSKLNYHVSTNSVHEFWIDGVSKWSIQGATSYLNTALQVSGQITQTGSNHIRCAEVDGFGIRMHAGLHVYKAIGVGGVLRKHTGGTQWKIENNDGGGRVDIATASLTTFLDMGLALPELEHEPEIQAFAREDNDNKGFDVAKVIGLLFAKIRALEAKCAMLEKRK